MEKNYTPTPWSISESASIYIFDKNDKVLVMTTPMPPERSVEEAKANAAHIVKCVNLHDELVQMLKEANEKLKQLHTYAADTRVALLLNNPPNFIDLDSLDDIRLLGKQVETLITKAEGK